MPEQQVENICFVLDASRSMFRRDYKPNRFNVAKEGIITILKIRKQEETNSGFALVVIGKENKVVLNFDDFIDENLLRETLDDIEIGGSSKISDGIGLAIKLHIEDIRKAGAKVPHILLISDGKLTKTNTNPTKMAEIAQGLEIKIDTIRLGEVEHFNIMKRISELTEGRYNYCNDAHSLIMTATEIAESTKGKKYQKSKNFSNILEKIAVPLQSISELDKTSSDIASRIRGTASFKKCGICFMEEDPITGAPFNISGRYCPNCGQGYHAICVSKWAENDKESNGRVVRCPHCFYLLKVEGDIQQVAKIREEYKREMESSQPQGSDQSLAIKKNTSELGDTALYNACPVCNTIFDEDEDVMKCTTLACNAIYHMDCYEEVDNKPCKMCGKKLVRSY